jgi:adenylosuccinate synthase
MKVDVLLGLQWGDEGKGKVVDVLTPKYDVVARFQGGPNAGHTLEFEGQKYVLRSIPSGIFQGNKVNIIGNGVVLDPALFKAEAEALDRESDYREEKSDDHRNDNTTFVDCTHEVTVLNRLCRITVYEVLRCTKDVLEEKHCEYKTYKDDKERIFNTLES